MKGQMDRFYQTHDVNGASFRSSWQPATLPPSGGDQVMSVTAVLQSPNSGWSRGILCNCTVMSRLLLTNKHNSAVASRRCRTLSCRCL